MSVSNNVWVSGLNARRTVTTRRPINGGIILKLCWDILSQVHNLVLRIATSFHLWADSQVQFKDYEELMYYRSDFQHRAWSFSTRYRKSGHCDYLLFCHLNPLCGIKATENLVVHLGNYLSQIFISNNYFQLYMSYQRFRFAKFCLRSHSLCRFFLHETAILKFYPFTALFSYLSQSVGS